MPERIATHRPLRAKLIFNAISGRVEESPQQLADILTEMQGRRILPEVCTVRPNGRLGAVNHHGGFGRWAFIEIADPWDAEALIRAQVAQSGGLHG